MKINSYQIGMDSAGTYSSTQTRKLSLSYTRITSGTGLAGSFADLISGSESDGYDQINEEQTKSTDRDSTDTSPMDRFDILQTDFGSRIRDVEHGDSLKSIDQVRERFVLYLWRILFGPQKADELADKYGLDCSDAFSSGIQPVSGVPFSVIKLNGVKESYFEESEALSFTSAGTVTTSDGRTIDFNLDINLSRSFSAYYREELQEVSAMCDPLVLNFTGDVADLTDTKFFFDLDADGTEDEISTLSAGNGFLALDKNGDGIINDGSELFGTRSGDGFKDLAAYDSDGNGWIDENDDIYDKLKIWIKDASGNDTLYSLKDKNVGAIYLGNADTNYGLRSNTTGNMNGMLRKTGIFLYEDGTGVGTVSHLDIAN